MRRLLPLLAVAVLVGAGWLVVQHLDNTGTTAGTATQTTGTASAATSPLVRPATAQGPYKVSHITDGDTIDVMIGRTSTVIRLLGIDTLRRRSPTWRSSATDRKPPPGPPQLLSGQSDWLETDPSQDKFNKYGRTLAYVWLDQTLIDDVLVREGYAHEYTYDKPYTYQARFLADQGCR